MLLFGSGPGCPYGLDSLAEWSQNNCFGKTLKILHLPKFGSF